MEFHPDSHLRSSHLPSQHSCPLSDSILQTPLCPYSCQRISSSCCLQVDPSGSSPADAVQERRMHPLFRYRLYLQRFACTCCPASLSEEHVAESETDHALSLHSQNQYSCLESGSHSIRLELRSCKHRLRWSQSSKDYRYPILLSSQHYLLHLLLP